LIASILIAFTIIKVLIFGTLVYKLCQF